MFDEDRLPPDPVVGEPFPDNRWYAALPAGWLGASRSVGVRRLGRDLVLWRDAAGAPHAAPLHCPHRGAPLAGGRVLRGELECPYHGFRFTGEGRCTAVPCDGAEARIPSSLRLEPTPVRDAHGWIWLWAGDPARAADAPLPWIDGMSEGGSRSCDAEMVWNVRASRMGEQILDAHHASFAHRKVLGGWWTELTPFEATLTDAGLRAEGVLRRPGRASGFAAEFECAFPGTFRVGLGGFPITAMICPIDGEFSWLGFRYTVDVPVIGGLLAWLLVQSELHLVQPDDWRMGRGTRPRSAEPGAGVLVRADRAIALYHRLWRQAVRAHDQPAS